MAYFYGNTISSHWRSYGLYTTSSSNTDYTITLHGGFQSIGWGYDLSGVTCTIKIGSYSKSGTGSVSTGTGESKNVRLVSDLSHTYLKGHSAQTITLSTSINRSSASYHAGTSTGSTTITIPAKPSYTVAYNANGGSGSMSNSQKWYGENLTLKTNTFTRTGYTFKGWATSSSGGVSYANGATYTANAGITLYAVWQINTWTVSYNGNKPSEASGSVTNIPANQTKTYGVTLKLSSNVPVLPLYNFLGYATSASGAVAYQPGGNYTSNAAATLYAKWELAYTIPDAPISVSATNVFDGDVSNTQVEVEVEVPDIPEGSMAHRTGYNIYINGALVLPVADDTQTSYSATHTLIGLNYEGKIINVSVACMGEAGVSAQVAAQALYGILGTPTVSDVYRGWSSALGYYATFYVADNSANAYEHVVQTTVNGSDVYTTTGAITITSVTGDAAWVNSDLSIVTAAVPVNVGYASATSIPLVSPKATYGALNLAATQVMSGGLAYALIVFDGAVGDDADTSYTISFDHDVASGTIAYDPDGYEYRQMWMGIDPLAITVIAERNGWVSQPISTSFTYVPRNLRAPTIVDVEKVAGAQFEVTYSEAEYGIPIDDDKYDYKLYLNGELVAEADGVEITGGTHTISLYVYDPSSSVIQMKAFDTPPSDGSPFSNSKTVNRTVPGAGIYAYQTKLDVERVRIDGVNEFMVTRNVSASVEHCSIGSKSMYNMEIDSDVITERDNTYSIGE